MQWRDKLHAALRAAGISHKRAAEAIGLTSGQAVTNKLAGKRPIEFEEVLALCKLAGISPSELNGEDALILEEQGEIDRTERIRALSEEQQRMLDALIEQMAMAAKASAAKEGGPS